MTTYGTRPLLCCLQPIDLLLDFLAPSELRLPFQDLRLSAGYLLRDKHLNGHPPGISDEDLSFLTLLALFVEETLAVLFSLFQGTYVGLDVGRHESGSGSDRVVQADLMRTGKGVKLFGDRGHRRNVPVDA